MSSAKEYCELADSHLASGKDRRCFLQIAEVGLKLLPRIDRGTRDEDGTTATGSSAALTSAMK